MNDPVEPTEPAEPGEDALEGLLRRAAGIFDPVPPHLLQTAVEAYTLNTLDAELAELTFDSLTEAAPMRGSGTAPGGQPRLLTFSGGGLTLDLEVTAGRVVGQVLPPQPAEVEILGRDQAGVTADELGRFACDRTAGGGFGVRCRTADAMIVTEWITA